MADKTMLVYGPSGNGKSFSLRNLDMKHLAYINIEKKPIPLKNAKQIALYKEPKTLNEVKACIKTAVEDNNIYYIVIDSITFLGDAILYPELVKDKEDTRAGWME